MGLRLRLMVLGVLSGCYDPSCYDSVSASSSSFPYRGLGGIDEALISWSEAEAGHAPAYKVSRVDGTGMLSAPVVVPFGPLIEGVRGKTSSAWLVANDTGIPTARVVVVGGGVVHVVDRAPHNVLGRLVVDEAGYRLFWTNKTEVHDVLFDEQGTVITDRRLALPLPFFSDLNVTADGSGEALLRTTTGYGTTAFLLDLASGAVLRVWQPTDLHLQMENEGVWFNGGYRMLAVSGSGPALVSVMPTGEVTVQGGANLHGLVVAPSGLLANEGGERIVRFDDSFSSFVSIVDNVQLQAATRDVLVTFERTDTTVAHRGELDLIGYSYDGSSSWNTRLALDGPAVHHEVCGQ